MATVNKCHFVGAEMFLCKVILDLAVSSILVNTVRGKASMEAENVPSP